jgi:glycosyltransferase involved in cell wall biosynthesis
MTASSHTPTVSVLLPVWNAERYLAGAIESVLAQTFTDFELLVVDDGSSDGSGPLIRRYRDRRIQCTVNEKNLGVTRSLNLCIDRARGRYLARMDADDLCAPERLEHQVAFLDAHPHVALVATGARRIDARGAELGAIAPPVDGEELRRRLRLGNCIVHGSVMMRAAAVHELGGYDASMERAQDYDLWLRLSERHAIAALPAILYAWREHDASVGQRHLEEQNASADRARLAARRRFAAALVEAVRSGTLTASAAARHALEPLWEEDAVRPGARGAVALWGTCARRAPRLHARSRALFSIRARARLRRILAACAAHRADPAATCAALVATLSALDPSLRGDRAS